MKTPNKKFVYCSGPLFCPEEIAGMSLISLVLEDAGFGTFLPQRDGLEAYLMSAVNSPLNINVFKIRKLIDKAIFALDVFQLVKRCDYFVFNMNGRVPDEGAVAETAMAFAAGKPIVIYKNDVRTIFKGQDNSMVSCLANGHYVSDYKKIPNEIKKVAKTFEKLGASPYRENNIPPQMKATIAYGEKIWNLLCIIPAKKNKKKEDAILAEILRVQDK